MSDNTNQSISKIMQFVNKSDADLREFMLRNPKAKKFARRSFNDSDVQERMMRCGIEARYFQPESEDEIFDIVVATLQNDHVRHEARRLTAMTLTIQDGQ